ncbi:MAG TPA: hypothetical protein VGO62_18070 [Myxococcota bacterium]
MELRERLRTVLTTVRAGRAPLFVDVDVFEGVDDVAALDPLDVGKRNAFLLWSKRAELACAAGQPVALHFGASPVQMAMLFAIANLNARIELHVGADGDTAHHHVFGATGTVVVNANHDQSESDLRRLLRGFAALKRERIVALACTAFTQSDGWSDVAEAQTQTSAAQSACSWTTQGHERAFDAVGTLTTTLHLYWRGDAEAIARVLREHRFSVRVPESEDSAIEVLPSSSTPLAIPAFADVLPGEPTPGSRAGVVLKRGSERVRVDVVARSPEQKAIVHVALAPSGARFAVGHRDDARGLAEHAVSIFEGERVLDSRRSATVDARFSSDRRLRATRASSSPATIGRASSCDTRRRGRRRRAPLRHRA